MQEKKTKLNSSYFFLSSFINIQVEMGMEE